jgi:hypothetical protein
VVKLPTELTRRGSTTIDSEGAHDGDEAHDKELDCLKRGKIPEYDEFCIRGDIGYFSALASLARDHAPSRCVKFRELMMPSDEEGAVVGDREAEEKMHVEPPKRAIQKNKIDLPTRICQENGCHKRSHSSTNFKYCCSHRKKPMTPCKKCGKNNAYRRGLLCDACFKSPENTRCTMTSDDAHHYCRVCFFHGFKREPRKYGGICTTCLSDGYKDTRKCPKCNLNERTRRKGGFCHSCSIQLCLRCNEYKRRRRGGLCDRCFKETDASRVKKA